MDETYQRPPTCTVRSRWFDGGIMLTGDSAVYRCFSELAPNRTANAGGVQSGKMVWMTRWAPLAESVVLVATGRECWFRT